MAVVADLETLKAYLGMTQTRDDAILQIDLDASTAYVQTRVMTAEWLSDDCQTAVIMMAARLYSRRRSPEGVAGFGSEGVMVRVLASDPDIVKLLEQHLDMSLAGLA